MPAKANALNISRQFTESGKDPFDKLSWSKRDVEIRNFDGSVAFSMKDVNLPDNYSQVAANVLAQKYLRKAGVPKKEADEIKAKLEAAGAKVELK